MCCNTIPVYGEKNLEKYFNYAMTFELLRHNFTNYWLPLPGIESSAFQLHRKIYTGMTL